MLCSGEALAPACAWSKQPYTPGLCSLICKTGPWIALPNSRGLQEYQIALVHTFSTRTTASWRVEEILDVRMVCVSLKQLTKSHSLVFHFSRYGEIKLKFSPEGDNNERKG